MAAFWMCELAPADAFNRNQLLLRETMLNDGASNVGRASAGRQGLQVLVIGDEPDKADELARLVDRWGHAVRVAYDGATGLKVAADQQPDVVLLDIAPPLAGECQVARQLRLDFPGKKCFIIAATGRPDDASPEQCSAAGIDLVLIKPVDPSIVETLLMLECQLAKRSQVADTGRVAAPGAPRFAAETDAAAESASAGLAAGGGNGQQHSQPS